VYLSQFKFITLYIQGFWKKSIAFIIKFQIVSFLQNLVFVGSCFKSKLGEGTTIVIKESSCDVLITCMMT